MIYLVLNFITEHISRTTSFYGLDILGKMKEITILDYVYQELEKEQFNDPSEISFGCRFRF